MKWFWLSGYDPKVDLFLLHEYNKGDESLVLLPPFAAVSRCTGCSKFNEQQILDVGFDLNRVFRLPQDILTWPNDSHFTIVTERFRDACLRNSISGVEFIPCGRRRRGGLLYIMCAVHRSQCDEPVERWDRGYTLKPGLPPYNTCRVCGRPVHVAGFPHRFGLKLPDELTISIPSIPTELRHGLDFRFFCSNTVRRIFKAEKLRGCCFTDLETRRPSSPPPANDLQWLRAALEKLPNANPRVENLIDELNQ